MEDHPRTDAELTREATIRADPLADIISPLYVRCRRCTQRIKLSPKSYFDLCHWTRHRQRCMRRSKEEIISFVAKEGISEASVQDSGMLYPQEYANSSDYDSTLQVCTSHLFLP